MNREEEAEMIATRVYFGSCQPEYYIWDETGQFIRYYSVYHHGPLPSDVKVEENFWKDK